MVKTWMGALLEKRLLGELELGAGEWAIDFSQPPGEPALAGPDSVSWRVFRSPVALLVGGIAAVIMELAEPRVRSGVWDYSSFRTDPLSRMRRTGYAALVTVYGPRSAAEKMIAAIGRMHARIRGTTPGGEPYRADDPQLLAWVHATALHGFMEAYHRHVRPLSAGERDQFVAEGVPAARLYGVENPPRCEDDLHAMFKAMLPRLERSEILFEFLETLARLPLLPGPLRPLAGLVIPAAVDLVPSAIRSAAGLGPGFPMPPGARSMLAFSGKSIARLPMPSLPPARACARLGLPAGHLLG
ncbi:oxygenase MpaB family protein [Haloferula sargassicola]|uniref:ER-bound oxygenase mpaB/mpaB'/Rubber oxygenase catalytic domain-containing protein n=1 Tax=Haloferula sargassicola TaxID=490096 RepID=A0ABP9ULQ1_9BACT